MSAQAFPSPSPLPAQSPHPQAPDDLKNLVSDVLRKRGILGSLKAQLRSSVFAILKSPDDATSVTLPLENAKVTALRATKEGRQSLLLVRDFLKTLGLEYTLAVFEPEVHLDDDDAAQNASLLNALNLPTTTTITPSAKPLLTQLLERQAVHHPATATATTTPPLLPLGKPLAPLHKPSHPPPPLPPPSSPSGPPPTKELPSPPKAASSATTTANPTSSWPTLSPEKKVSPPPPQPKALEAGYEDDGFDEDDAAGDMADLDRILGGGGDDDDGMEESDLLSEQKHPGPVSANEDEDDDQPVVFSPSEVEVMTSDRSVSPEAAQAAGLDLAEDVEVGGDDDDKNADIQGDIK
ncbi:FGFR1 oncoprotein partner [Geranomyces variabilis]|uniref:Centrosomal protein 43 n=1 Tax=Geranomyces variabilis TaxID=109894 RepID=A0AAD5TH84_9FUNG|nr:FGFR1 oncoprotein partner [Geranomyces variabilis]